MALDLITLGREGESAVIITDDFDLVPPALLFGSQSPDRLLWVSLKNTTSIEAFLIRSGIRFASV
jgi:predicted nuclease of predicted toxin-antitoxin system